MAVFTVDTAADIASQNGAANWWNTLLGGNGTNPFTTGTTPSGLAGLFGAGAPTGPAIPAGTVSPLSTLFSQIPTGLATSTTQNTKDSAGDVIKGFQQYIPNTSLSADPGSMFLPTGSQWTPRAGYDIVYGVKNGTYGHFQIPSADVANAAEKYGIGVMGSPLSVAQINYHNNPAGGPNQTQTPGTPPPSGGNNTPPVTPPGGGGDVTTPPPPTPPPPPGPQLPELDTKRQSYLTAIDNFIKSQKPYATIDDALRRSFNLPGMAELQMNQQANPQVDLNNFIDNPAGNPFSPGSAPPQGFKWYWADPDGTGANPGNYTLVPQQDFFSALPGSNIEDLQTLVDTYNNPTFANKYTPTNLSNLLGDWGKFLNLKPQGATGPRASLTPQESISQLAPFMQRGDLYSYFNSLIDSVKGGLGSGYGPNYSVFNDINDPTKVTNYLNSVGNALSLANLPGLKDILAGGQKTIDSSQFYQGKSLDFYTPQTNAPAFFQYLLDDRDGTSGPQPATYGLRLKGAPDTKFDANKILETLNNPQYQRMIGANSNLTPYGNIFTSILNSEGNPIFKLLDSYKFPGGEGGPPSTGTGTGSLYSQSVSPGGAGGPSLSMERWTPSASDTLNANQQQADMAKNTTTQANSLNSVPSIYGGGDGTAGLGSTPSTTTTPAPFTPTTGTTPPATDTRKPSFFTPYSYWT